VRGVVGHELRRAATGGKGDGGGLQPLRALLGHALLKEEVAGDAVAPALERRRALAQVIDGRVGDAQVVLGEVVLRYGWVGRGLRKVDLVGDDRRISRPAASSVVYSVFAMCA
jgi:hypothetical protein